jgi:hypothetical protein
MICTGSQSLVAVLHAERPPPDIAAKMNLYGQFVGPWDTEVAGFEENGRKHTGRGEIHFGWVLEGRAVQDVWMIPPRAARRPDMHRMPVTGNWYGTTLRVYDPGLDAWHIIWSDPATRFYARQIGRARGNDIVQDGKLDSGAVLRWSFTEITATSFRWRGERSDDAGATWRLQVEVLARRAGAPQTLTQEKAR